MTDAYIIDTCRTPRGIGKAGKGALAGLLYAYLLGAGLAWAYRRYIGMDAPTAFFAGAIGGASEMALKGVAYRAVGAAALLRRNLLVYGLGGVIVPFIGIKLIDLGLAAIGLA